jgi:hypothetical protein
MKNGAAMARKPVMSITERRRTSRGADIGGGCDNSSITYVQYNIHVYV